MEQLHCNCTSLRSAARTLTSVYDEVLRPSGIRVTQFTILARLAAIGETRVNELAEKLAMDRTTLGRNLRPLERDELVQIRVGEDRRERLIDLSPKGRRVLQTAMPLWESIHDRFERQFGKRRAKDLREVLADVVTVGQALYVEQAA
ncbi:MarR family winged helix-turn-helix transcriptional regulator [Bordetella flabilis]|uniref:MarR family winged helix-turn-helix transcriptional regulator n=1 Tax=Bordetella flabilis TaxID=463014 RepID=UPI000A01B677|nr:MarR family transcriptional regulator [Bordetella flabilis]